MRTKQILAGLMSVTMLCSLGIPASAAEMSSISDPSAEPQVEQAPARVLTWGTIQSIIREDGAVSMVTLYRPAERGGELVLHVSAETIALDSATGKPVGLDRLKEGDSIYAFHSSAMTLSLPPQTAAEAIVTDVPQDAGCAMLHTVEQVERVKDGGIRILTDNGGLYITVDKDAEVSPLYTKNIVSLEDVKQGDRVFAWYNVVLESYPGQAYTDKLVLIPGDSEPQTSAPMDSSCQIVIDGDMVLPQKAVVKNNVVMVPLRAVAETLGCKVAWDSAARTATITDDTRTMAFTIGMDLYVSAAAPETGLIGMTSPIKLGAAPYLDAEGRTWVPAEAFEVMIGYRVSKTDTAIEIAPQELCGYPNVN